MPELCRFYNIVIKMLSAIPTSIINRTFMCIIMSTKHLSAWMVK